MMIGEILIFVLTAIGVLFVIYLLGGNVIKTKYSKPIRSAVPMTTEPGCYLVKTISKDESIKPMVVKGKHAKFIETEEDPRIEWYEVYTKPRFEWLKFGIYRGRVGRYCIYVPEGSFKNDFEIE